MVFARIEEFFNSVKLAMRPGRQCYMKVGHAQMLVEAAGPMVCWRDKTESSERVQILLTQMRRQALSGALLATELAIQPGQVVCWTWCSGAPWMDSAETSSLRSEYGT